MKLLRELLRESTLTDKYVHEQVENLVDVGDYVPSEKPSKKKKKTKTSDAAQTSIVNTIWFYSNSDAT